MVDSISSGSGPQNLTQIGSAQNNKNSETKRSDKAEEARSQDEVQLSEEALEAQAEAAARETRTILEKQLEETLSSNAKRVDKLL